MSWILHLQQTGYAVQQGTATEFSFNDCTMVYAPVFGSCFGNNPVTPYIVLHPPVSPAASFLPKYMKNNFTVTGPTGAPNGSTGATSNTFYQLDSNEAIVTVMTLPPQAAYYSFQSYMFSRPLTNYTYMGMPIPPYQGSNCPTHYPSGSKSITTPDCLDYQIFGYFDNAINNVVVKSQSGLQFTSNGSQAIAIITTPNQMLYSNLTAAFAAYGNTNQIFFEHMPTMGTGSQPPLLQIGASAPGDDIFASIIRYAVASDGGGGQTPSGLWLANASSNVLVYRVQLPSLQPSPMPNNMFNTQSCNNNETAAAGAPANCPTTSAFFDDDIQKLIGLLQGWAGNALPQFTYIASQFTTGDGQASMGGSPQGPNCITNGNPCVGSTADNNAYRAFNIGKLPQGAPAFVVGVYHSASSEVTTTVPVNNATYTSVAASDARINAGVKDIDQANLAQVGFPQPAT